MGLVEATNQMVGEESTQTNEWGSCLFFDENHNPPRSILPLDFFVYAPKQ